jgi:hypothetical protein
MLQIVYFKQIKSLYFKLLIENYLKINKDYRDKIRIKKQVL